MRTLYSKVLETSVNGLIEFKVMCGSVEEMPTVGLATGSMYLDPSTGIVSVYDETDGWVPQYTIQSESSDDSDAVGLSLSPMPVGLNDRVDLTDLEEVEKEPAVEEEPVVEEEEVVTTKKRGK